MTEEYGPRTKKLIPHPDLEIYRPMRITWVGFLIAWGIVLATFFLTWVLATIGG